MRQQEYYSTKIWFYVFTILAVLYTADLSTLHAQTWVITGTVTDAAGGPIPAVDIDLVDPLNPALAISLTGDSTDLNGVFSATVLSNIATGEYILQFEPTSAHLSQEMTISLNGNLDIGTVALANGWLLSGQVVNSDGLAMSGIDIDIRSDQSGWLDLIGDETNPQGFFSVAIPAIIDEYRITFSDTALNPTVFPNEIDLGLLFGDTDTGVVTMDLAHTLTGLVVDENGVALPGIDMNVYDLSGAGIDLFNDDTNASGVFNVLVPQGTWEIRHRLVSPIAGEERVTHVVNDLIVNSNIDMGTVVVPLGYHLLGTVVSSAGTPILGAIFDAEYTTTTTPIYLSSDITNAAGEFDLLLPAGLVTLEVDPPLSGPTRISKRVSIDLPSSSPINLGTILLEDGINITGSFTDSLGTSIPLVDVEFYRTVNGQLYDTLHENGNAAGDFSAVVYADDYNLTLTPPAGSNLAPKYIYNQSCYAPTTLGTIVLEAAVNVSGIVWSATSPLPNTLIEATNVSSGVIPPWGSTLSNPDGTYQLNLGSGVWTLTASAPAGTGLQSKVIPNVSIDSDLSQDFQFPSLAASIFNLECVHNNQDVSLTWENGMTYDWIQVIRDGIPIATLAGTETSFIDTPAGSGSVEYSLRGVAFGIFSEMTDCIVDLPILFIRCDADMNSVLTISDAINVLGYLFSSTTPVCLDALDCNDSGSINIADPVLLLDLLFGNGPLPPLPYPTPGDDPTLDSLNCI